MNNRALRDYRFDNLKGILIFLVILIHALGKFILGSTGLASYMRSVLVPFPMPVFAFISGFFSKNVFLTEKTSTKLVKSLLIPFVVAHSLMWLLTSRSIGSFFYPEWTLWYLLSLFFWKILIAPISRLRCAITISLIMSICIGFSPADRFFALSRTVAFFPFFLMGHKITPTILDRIRNIHKSIPILILLALLFIIILMVKSNLPISDASYMADPYSSLNGVSKLQGMFLRVIVLFTGFIATACLLVLVPQKQSIISNLGKNSMTVYLGHSFSILILKQLLSMTFPALMKNDLFVIIFSIALSIIICFIFSNKWAVSLYNKVMDWISSIVLVKT